MKKTRQRSTAKANLRRHAFITSHPLTINTSLTLSAAGLGQQEPHKCCQTAKAPSNQHESSFALLQQHTRSQLLPVRRPILYHSFRVCDAPILAHTASALATPYPRLPAMADANPPPPKTKTNGGENVEARKQLRRRRHIFPVVIDVIRSEAGLTLVESNSTQAAATEKVLRVLGVPTTVVCFEEFFVLKKVMWVLRHIFMQALSVEMQGLRVLEEH